MSTTYRYTIFTDSVREHKGGRASLGYTHTPERDSKKVQAMITALFREHLSKHVPDGRNARAWLEKADGYGTSTLESYTGKATKCTTLPGQAIEGEWTEKTTGATISAKG